MQSSEMNEQIREFRAEVESYQKYVMYQLWAAQRRAEELGKSIAGIRRLMESNAVDAQMALELLNEARGLQLIQPEAPE